MSQSQQSDLPSSLYDGEIDNLTYLTHSHPLATPSETQHTFDTLDTSFLRPAIPLTIPSILERVGPDQRKAYILYNKMSHNKYVE
jgi:GT2 family glycosyltransferase